MSTSPFLSLTVRGRKDVLALRQKARLVARLLRYERAEQTCIAAGAFAVAWQAQRQLGKARICFLLEQEQLHVFVQACAEPAGTKPRQPTGPLFRLAKPLPRESVLGEIDIAWLVRSLEETGAGTLFDEVVQQNDEVLTLLHELQLHRKESSPQKGTNDQSAA